MSDYEIRPSLHERRVEFHSHAPEAKHDYKYRGIRTIRLAGEIWEESLKERGSRLAKERTRKKMKSSPVGVGFGVGDGFGPDDNYATKESLNNTHVQYY
jgi:hypothetical protein